MASFALNKKSKALLAQKENPKMISTPTRLRPSPLLTSSAAATKLGRNPLIIRRDQAGFSPRTAFSCKLSLRHQDSDFSQKIINGNTLKRLSNNKEVSASASASVSASASASVSASAPISAPVSASASASAQYIRMSADKVRRVIDQIRGRSYEQTLMILELMPYRACEPILKLLYSAAANGVHNLGLNEASLYIVRAEVNEGPVAKRFRFKARGRTHMIRRRTCHVTIVLKDMSVDGNGSF